MARSENDMARSAWGSRRLSALALLSAALLCTVVWGCASTTNPVEDGLPVRRLPVELLTRSKDDALTIPLSALGQPPSDVYRLASEDVLGVWIDGVLGERGLPLPVHIPAQSVGPQQRRPAPSIGYPIAVRADGTISLPLVEPIPVQGLSVTEAEEAIRKTYQAKQILPPGRDRIFVSLLHARESTVVVMRQEAASFASGLQGVIGATKRGTGFVMDLPAGENDVLHALGQSGGLPGLDACNEIIIYRGYYQNCRDHTTLLEHAEALRPPGAPLPPPPPGVQVIRIPLRLPPGSTLPFHPQDVILHTGDVVFLEARDKEIFYTGGLLPPGEYLLPRDRDLTVTQAVSFVRGPLVNGAFATSNLSGTLIQPGIGNPSPSLLIVLRRLPAGKQLAIRVDLNKALRDPRENILVHSGDMLILQEKPQESLTRYMTQTFFNFNILWTPIQTSNALGVVDVATPDRLGTRAIYGTLPSVVR